MKVYFNFSHDKFLNSYLVANEKTKEAILIDPLKMNMDTIHLIEMHQYTLTHLLFTHGDKNLRHEGALTTTKVYRDAKIVHYELSTPKASKENNPAEITLSGGDGKIELAGMPVEYFSIAGLGWQAFCFKIEHIIFCGDSLLSGRIGKTTSDYASQNLQQSLKEKIFSKSEKLLLFPSQGAPTSIAVEKKYNADLKISFVKQGGGFMEY